MDKDSVECNLAPGDYCEKNIQTKVGAKTLNGYNLNISVPTVLNGANGHQFAGINMVPKDGNGFAFRYGDSNEWSAASQNLTGLAGVRSDAYSITFGAAATFATPADTYTGKITFTITARQ